ncbi:MAG: biotin--[acetyl-CoA-carboxylase] ligase, partial [Candidatus Nanopelagicales bacterium]
MANSSSFPDVERGLWESAVFICPPGLPNSYPSRVAAAMSSAQPLLTGLLSDQPLATADLTWVESTGSTNADLVNDLASNHASAWSIRIATKQSHGRGRQGRSWESPTGSIPISIAVPLDEFMPAPTWLSVITAIALRNAIREFIAEPISIKWPNDCLI